MILNRDDTDLTALETLAGLNPGALESLKYQVASWGHTVTFQGTSLSAEVLKLSRPKLCPACLQESNYCRRVWDLLPYTACPQHEIVLLDMCPECRGRVSWSRSKVSRCHCDFDWRNASGVKASPAELKAAERISELCRGADGHTNEESNNKQLYRLGLGELCEALLLFAGYYLMLKDGLRISADTENSACHEAFVYAFAALEEWPNRVQGFMQKFGIITGQSRILESILELHGQFRQGNLNFITIALEEFIENTLSQNADRFCGTKTLHRRFIPATDIALYCVARPRRLKWLLSSGRVRVLRKARDSGDEVLVDWDSVVRYKEKLNSCFTSVDLAECLEIRVEDVIELVRHGCLKPVSGPSIDGLPTWRFYRDEPERLLGAINAKVLAEDDGDHPRWLFGREVLSLLRKHEISVGHFVHDILNGKLIPQSKSCARGLPMLSFVQEEIAEYVFAKTGENIYAKENSIPAFKRLGRTLGKMKERNDRAYLRGQSRRNEISDWSCVSVSDLARVAIRVFSMALGNVV